MEFKDVLKKLRTKCGLSQAKLAENLSLSKSRIGAYETGERTPSYEVLELICDYFNVDMNYLTGKDDGSTYYLDPEAAEAAKEMYERPELKVLFDASRNVTKDDILDVAKILEKFKREEQGPDYEDISQDPDDWK